MNFFTKYPMTDAHELNLDWLIKTVKKCEKIVDDFTVFNKIVWAGTWDASKSYTAWNIVQDNDGNGYVSIKAVPANVNLTNTDYWILVAEYDALYAAFNTRITDLENTVGDNTQGLVKDVDDLQSDVSTINSDISDIQTDVSTLKSSITGIAANGVKGRRFILLSDSYGNRVDADGNTFFTNVKNNLNIADDDYYHNNLAGAAFAHGTPTARFEYLLTQLEGTVTTPETITDIMVIGGANDVNYGATATLSAIQSFMNYCKTEYPNAIVTLIPLGLTFTSDAMNLRWYNVLIPYRTSINYGARLIANAEYILCNTTLLESDMCHPNAAGVSEISKQLCSIIINGACDVHYFQWMSLTSGSATGYTISSPSASCTMSLDNGIAKFNNINGNFDFQFDTNLVINESTGFEIKLEIPESLISGSDDTLHSNAKKACFGYLVDRDNPKHQYQIMIIPQLTLSNKWLRVFLREDISSSDGVYHIGIYMNDGMFTNEN